MRKMCKSHIVQKKESDEWFSSLQYLNAKINDLTISNSFLDGESEFGKMNDVTINAFGWKADKPSDFAIKGNSKYITKLLGWFTDIPISIKNKDSKTITATGNFTHINNGEPEPILYLGIKWIRKVQSVLDPNKNQFQMKLHGKTYTIPTYSKASVTKDLPKEEQNQVSTDSSNPTSEDLKKNIALSLGIQLGTRNSFLIKNNESFSERVCQLKNEARELKNEINQKEISFASAKSKIATKLKEIQALHSRIEELEQDVSLTKKRLSEMNSLKHKSELKYIKLSDKNISLDLAKMELEDTLAKKKDELMQVRDDLLSAQKAVIEKDSLLQETNTLLLEQISKTSSESKQNEVIGGDKGLEKEKNILNYKIPLNRNQGYTFPIRYVKEPKDRTISYEISSFGYR
ncbi:hypothetical protein C1645_862028 [Glomus cerebriforme]|uniref:Uncharacterized protein n=1 Tax=Glomus cerebriforme TaxID=658196 RepID=A0A397SF34_9GLOM|nr:hypothetical protein C1645_862028 [Glomus cerebriforme]